MSLDWKTGLMPLSMLQKKTEAAHFLFHYFSSAEIVIVPHSYSSCLSVLSVVIQFYCGPWNAQNENFWQRSHWTSDLLSTSSCCIIEIYEKDKIWGGDESVLEDWQAWHLNIHQAKYGFTKWPTQLEQSILAWELTCQLILPDMEGGPQVLYQLNQFVTQCDLWPTWQNYGFVKLPY